MEDIEIMIRQILKKIIPLFLVNYLRRYLIYFPLENAGNFNGKILQQYSLCTKEKENICIFSHFDKDGIIDDYVICYLQEIQTIGFDIVFISTCESLLQNEIEKIKSYCRDILVKENIGYDFGAWKTGIDYLTNELDKYESLLLCNDSVYAPLFPLNEMFQKMQGKYDFWGITDSYEMQHHLQSYFMVFDKKIFSCTIFQNIWKTYKIYQIKRNIILRYEIGLSQKLLKNGYHMGVYCAYNKLNSSKICNALHCCWKELIEKFRCPILKIEILRDNPKNIDISEWKDVINTKTDYDVELIKQHLSRIKRQKFEKN